jgi:Putative transposase of IS4/5 family (DUF4096)
LIGGEVGCVHFDWEDGTQMPRPLVSDELWELVEPLLPKKPRRFRYPGRKRIDDRKVLTGILFVLRTGIPWEYLPQEMGCGSGVTCWRRLREWQQAAPGCTSTGDCASATNAATTSTKPSSQSAAASSASSSSKPETHSERRS